MTSPADLFEQVTVLRQAGLTLKEVAEKLGVSIGSAWRYDNKRKQKLTQEDLDRKQAWACHRRGLTVPEIAKELNLDVYWVHNVIYKPKKISD